MLATLWLNLGANVGARIDVPWTALGDTIAALPEGALFSCAAFKENKRSKDAFECATAVVLDHDAGTVALEAAAEKLKAARALVYPTKTNGRWRAILPLVEPIAGYEDYTALVTPIREALKCARESATGAQMWYPPRNGFRYLSPFDGEKRLLAWINGDYDSPLVARDLPRHADGTVDRSVLDMHIALRLAEIGIVQTEAQEIFRTRNGLSHRCDDAYITMTWRNATRFRQTRIDSGEEWGNGAAKSDQEISMGPDIHRVADESIVALAADTHLFTRDASIVELNESGGRLPVTREVSSASIQDRLSRVASLYRQNKEGERIRITPPRELTDVVKDRGTYPALRVLRGITEVPILRADGSLATALGYDAATGFYREGSLALDFTEQSPQEALATLREPFLEFPWAKPEMLDIPVALICSIACRAAVEGNVPLFVFDASKAASGKSLLVETISAIASGHASGAGRFPGDDDELAKVLSGYARSSASLIAFDNVTRTVQGEALDSALTCNGRVSFRLLGQSKIQVCDWYSVIAINGNQIRVGGDTRRRTIISRLTPARSKADHRLQLPQYAYTNRAKLLSAAISLIRHGIASGVPALDHRASFETFVRVVAGAIVAAGGCDITQFWKEEDVVTESDEAREAFTLWIALRWPNGATASQIIDDLGDGFIASAEAQALLNTHGLEKPIKEAMRFVCEAHPGATKRQAMAYALHAWRDIPSLGVLRIKGESGRNVLWRAADYST